MGLGPRLRKERDVWVLRTGKKISAAATDKALSKIREERDVSIRGDTRIPSIDAQLREAAKGPYYGPFETAGDAIKFLNGEIRKRRETRKRKIGERKTRWDGAEQEARLQAESPALQKTESG